MNMLSLVYCEMRKAYKSSVFFVVTIAFTILPILSLIKYLNATNASWDLYLGDTLGGIFVSYMIMGFAFTTCWIFGREYTDKTINDLLVKPISKLRMVVSKFIVIFLWNSLLTILMFVVATLIGLYVGLVNGTTTFILQYFLMFAITSVLTMIGGTLSSFLANVTKGYLAPIGLIFISMLAVNIAENVGLSAYIPWTIPGLVMSDGFLSPISITILAITGIVGFVGTVAWWRFRDQK